MSTVTVSSIIIPQWQYGGTTAKLRLFLDRGFVASSGIPLQASAPGSGQFYKDVTVTISGTDATIASFTLDSTTDGLDLTGCRYSAFFYTTSGSKIKSFEGFASFALGPSPATVDWDDIRTFNFNLVPNRDMNAYTKAQSDGRYATIGSAGVADPGAGGFMARTGLNVSTARTFTDGAGITWTNGDGASGNPSAAWNPSTVVNSVSLWDGTAASRTLTANLSGTDPVITFGSGVVNISTGTLQQGGVAVALQSVTLTAGAGLTGSGDLSANRTFDVGQGTGISVAADSIAVDQAFAPTWTGVHIFTPAARSSGVAPFLTVNAPSDTALTASTEAIGVSFVGATRQHATGALATQREYVFAKPTYSFVGSSALTTAATLAITGAPVAGTNVSNPTTANLYALWVQADRAHFDGTITQTVGAGDPLNPFNEVTPIVVKMSLGAVIADSTSGNWFGINSHVENTGTAAATAVHGTAKCSNGTGVVFGGNFGAFANVSGAIAQGLEINACSLVSGGVAYPITVVYSGTFDSAAPYMQINSGSNGKACGNGILISKVSGFQPILVTGSIFKATANTGTMDVANGIDFSVCTFTGNLLKGPNNAGIAMLDSVGGTSQIFFYDTNDDVILARQNLVGGRAGNVLVGLGTSKGFYVKNHSGTNLLLIAEATGKITITTGTATASAGAATLSTPSGTITSESLTTAAAGFYTLTVTNALCSDSSQVFAEVFNGTNSGGQAVILRTVPQAGSFVVIVENHGASAFNGTLKFSFLCING
jgi:hypothetical protein